MQIRNKAQLRACARCVPDQMSPCGCWRSPTGSGPMVPQVIDAAGSSPRVAETSLADSSYRDCPGFATNEARLHRYDDRGHPHRPTHGWSGRGSCRSPWAACRLRSYRMDSLDLAPTMARRGRRPRRRSHNRSRSRARLRPRDAWWRVNRARGEPGHFPAPCLVTRPEATRIAEIRAAGHSWSSTRQPRSGRPTI
jgi:hypothetical protein